MLVSVADVGSASEAQPEPFHIQSAKQLALACASNRHMVANAPCHERAHSVVAPTTFRRPSHKTFRISEYGVDFGEDAGILVLLGLFCLEVAPSVGNGASACGDG